MHRRFLLASELYQELPLPVVSSETQDALAFGFGLDIN